MAENGMAPAPHTPVKREKPAPLTKAQGREAVKGVNWGSSHVQARRVPEDVGCTLVKLDYRPSREKDRTTNQRANNGRKMDRELLEHTDGTLATFDRTVGAIERARKAQMDADAATRKASRAGK